MTLEDHTVARRSLLTRGVASPVNFGLEEVPFLPIILPRQSQLSCFLLLSTGIFWNMAAVMDLCRDLQEIEGDMIDVFLAMADASDEECDSQEAVDGNDIKLRIRKPRKRRLGYIPPVVKHDIRRHYSRMVINVANSCDIPLLKSFLETYGALDKFAYSFEMDQGHYSRNNSNIFLLNSLHETLHFYTIRDRFLPDAVANVTNTRVVTRSDSDKCEIHCELTVRMTIRYDYDMFALHESLLPHATVAFGTSDLQSSQKDSISQSFDCQDSEVDDVMRIFRRHQPLSQLPYEDPFEMYYNKTGTHIPLQPRPLSLIVKTSMLLVTNGRRQIERIHHGKSDVLVA